MKIAILFDAPLRLSLINESTMKRLQELGEVTMNTTGMAEKETVMEVLRGADVAVTSWGVPRLDKEILDCAPNLKLVAHAAGSVKDIVSDELFARGIRVISSASALSYGVSETALGFTIAACKNFFAFHDSIKQGGWVTDYSVVTELFNITIGVVGCGYAGRHYIELLRNFSVNILAYDPLLDEQAIAAMGAEKVDLPELLRRSDVVSLHAPSIAATYHMIDSAALNIMKGRAILINTARGSLVDEAALAAAMQNGKLKYACLDVTDPEPPLQDSPLRKIPNCIMTPHIAGAANNGKQKIGTHVYDEINRYLHGEPLISEITKNMLAGIA